MSNWDITVSVKSIATGEVLEEFEKKTFNTRHEAEEYLMKHPSWEQRMTFLTATLYNIMLGSVTLDPTKWNHIHALRRGHSK